MKLKNAWGLVALLLVMLLVAGCTQSSAPPYSPSASAAPGTAAPLSSPSSETVATSGTDSCAGQTGDALTQCEGKAAVAQKDVTLCTRLADQNGRFICITAWCGSQARDYKQCGKLSDYNDNLACLNKCNPNSNT